MTKVKWTQPHGHADEHNWITVAPDTVETGEVLGFVSTDSGIQAVIQTGTELVARPIEDLTVGEPAPTVTVPAQGKIIPREHYYIVERHLGKNKYDYVTSAKFASDGNVIISTIVMVNVRGGAHGFTKDQANKLANYLGRAATTITKVE